MKKMIDFNHISDKLSEDQIKELHAYYHVYHKKQWCYTKAYKRLKKKNGN